MELVDQLKKHKIVSIIGMSKNSGKTVTLNHIIGEANENDIKIGLSSIGMDGETEDIVTFTEKPMIYVEEGSLIATASSLLSIGDATIEILQSTGYRTAIGEIIIGKVRSPGHIQIAGPRTLKEVKEVADKLLDLGAEFVIIDGALDRKTPATPAISQATILSTGAVVSRDMNIVVEKTLHTSKLLSLDKVEEYEDIINKLMEEEKVAIIENEGKIIDLKLRTALGKGQYIAEHIKKDSKYLLIPGSLVKSTLEDIVSSTNRYKDIDIVINDGTKVFIEPRDFQRYMKLGLRLKTLFQINLIAITINPYAPSGYYFEPMLFLDTMRKYIPNVKIMDVIGGD